MNPDFRDMLFLFIEENVEYLVVGAYAMGAHGVPRFTGDIDLWVYAERDNAQRVRRALAKFGAPIGDLSVEDLSSPNLVFQIGIAPQRIDVMTSITGVAFEDAWPNRLTAEIAGMAVNVIGRNELIRNKRATGRPKDLLDTQILEQAKG
jgi:hypothetical protein